MDWGNKTLYTGQILRRHLLWTADWLRGSPFRKHLRDIEFAFNHPEKYDAVRRQRLAELLKHACSTTKYYSRFSDHKSLSDFSVLNKTTLKRCYDDFISNKYDQNFLPTTRTSGSYGLPFTYYMSNEKHNRRFAEILYFNGWAGYRPGMRFAQVRPKNFSRLYKLLNNSITINPYIINEEWLCRQRNVLLTQNVEFLIAYPGALLQIAAYCESRGDTPEKFRLRGIVCSAEGLTPGAREKFNSVFGCPVFDRYAAQELGVIAHESVTHDNYYVNFASHYFELLAFDKDEPVKPGEPGRVVITDLFSHAMPLVRYETGDSAELDMDTKGDPYIPKIKSIHGRILELIYKPNGDYVNWAALFDVIDLDPELTGSIFQYQFIQNSRNAYTIKLCVKPSFDQEVRLLSKYQDLLGDNAKIMVEYVDSIPPLASGKRPIIINNTDDTKSFTNTLSPNE